MQGARRGSDGAVALSGAVLRGERIEQSRVCVAGPRIVGSASRELALPPGWTIAPGFVDLQVNGFAGAEVGDDPDLLAAVAAALPRAGVTAFLATLVSRDLAAYRRCARAFDEASWPVAGARPLGIHLEGPFLAPTRRGAHVAAALRAPTRTAVAELLAVVRPRMLTLAPELPGALDAIPRLARAGILVAAGHTEADAAVARAAIAAGARLLTHAPNAMRGIANRDPSALVAFLGHPRAFVSLIGDGVHVAPEVALLLARLAGRRLVLVSDAISGALAGPGEYPLGPARVRSDGTRTEVDGRLAGALRGLDAGPRMLHEAGLSRAAALSAAAHAPRRALGLPEGLRAGGPADLVLLDSELRPRLTVVSGRVAHADRPPIGAVAPGGYLSTAVRAEPVGSP
jgi:N-acetylglucosamine-6-phosphate deacetylase